MAADHAAILAQLDAIGIGADLDRPADGARQDRVLVVVEPDQARLRQARPAPNGSRRKDRHRAPGSAARPRTPPRSSCRAISGCGCVFAQATQRSSSQAFSSVIALHPQPRREQALPHRADLVLDLALLPARGRRAGDRLDEIVAAHLLEAAIVGALLARRRSRPPRSSCCHRCLFVQAPRKKANARSWASNTISCVSRG